MEPTFLISNIPQDVSQEIVSAVASIACPGFTLIEDFEKVEDVQRKFTGITCVIDVSKNSDSLAKFLKSIPPPNYIVNFNGPEFSQTTLNTFRSCGVTYKERERGHSELNFAELADDEDAHDCRIIVNVVESRSKAKAVTKKIRKFVRKTKNKVVNLGQDEEESDEENAPLLNRPDTNEESTLLTSLLSFCCPCFFKAPEPVYCFRNRQELHLQMQIEQLAEIQKAFKKLHAESNSDWNGTLRVLERKKAHKIEELESRVDELRENEEQQLKDLKDQQNANTRNTGVFSGDTLRKIEESRSRQTEGTVKHNADRVYREGETIIYRQVTVERAQLKERHYCKLVEQQIQKLSEIQLKYQRKTRSLLDQYFKNTA